MKVEHVIQKKNINLCHIFKNHFKIFLKFGLVKNF